MWVVNTDSDELRFTRQAYAGDVPPPFAWADINPHRDADNICILYGNLAKPDPVTKELPAELFYFELLTDQWICAGLQQEIWDLDLDLQ